MKAGRSSSPGVVTTFLYNAIIKSPVVPGGTHYRIPLRYADNHEAADLWQNADGGISQAVVDAEVAADLAVREKEEAGRLLIEQLTAQAESRIQAAEAARQEAEAFLKQARLDADKIRAEARALAQEEGVKIAGEAQTGGYEAGYREGMAKAVAEGEEIRGIARDIVRQAEEHRRETIESLEGKLIELSLEIAEKMIAAQLTMEPDTVCNIAKEALRLIEDRMLVVLYINPAEIPLYESKMEELKSMLPLRAELQLIADAAVHTGGCRIESESGTVDTTLETRRTAILTALYGE